MEKNEYTYQDCIEHLKKCREDIAARGKALLKQKGLPEYYFTDMLRIPSFTPIGHGSIANEFYNFISIMTCMIMDSMYDLCKAPELYNAKRLLRAQEVKLQNMELQLERLKRRKYQPGGHLCCVEVKRRANQVET